MLTLFQIHRTKTIRFKKALKFHTTPRNQSQLESSLVLLPLWLQSHVPVVWLSVQSVLLSGSYSSTFAGPQPFLQSGCLTNGTSSIPRLRLETLFSEECWYLVSNQRRSINQIICKDEIGIFFLKYVSKYAICSKPKPLGLSFV